MSSADASSRRLVAPVAVAVLWQRISARDEINTIDITSIGLRFILRGGFEVCIVDVTRANFWKTHTDLRCTRFLLSTPTSKLSISQSFVRPRIEGSLGRDLMLNICSVIKSIRIMRHFEDRTERELTESCT